MVALTEGVTSPYPVEVLTFGHGGTITTYRAWTFATAASASGSVNAPA